MNIFRLLNNDIQDLSEEERIFAEKFNETLRNNIIDTLVEYEIEALIKQLKDDLNTVYNSCTSKNRATTILREQFGDRFPITGDSNTQEYKWNNYNK